MTDLMQRALATVRGGPAELQDEATEILLALDRLREGPHRASDPELRAVDDEAMAQLERGALATEAQVEAAFARFRK
jgi:hypothetical protein